ncbi:DUF1657 domain-containing protein [Alkaliphilus serpentinus]|uniref:DUF1657 domain-containing protein n=1 Tax=Alkaliphilus serpentinus TaxID=1482731 RepID=A0A833MA57_9FIRM|nr:DUF1657 domain-containing protein [Alkaliphilus serpentinus]KAB3531490.1 DUF1657 domain-containing protein [Alkaliphilus serpentinus]
MTVGSQIQQTIATIQSASASLKTFALETQDQTAKTEFQQAAQNLDHILTTLKNRQNYINQQEPQYRQQ